METKWISFLSAVLLGAVAIASAKPADQPEPIEVAYTSRAATGTWGVDLSGLSQTTTPGTNFFRYVNAGWIDTTQAPPGYSAFMEMNAAFLRTEERIKEIIAVPANDGSPEARQKIQALYRSYVDGDGIERRGLEPIRNDVSAIMAIRSADEVAVWMARPMSSSIVGVYVYPDFGDARRNLLHLDQQVLGGRMLGLRNPENYTRNDGNRPERRETYKAYVTSILNAVGVDRADERASDVLALETRLAGTQWEPTKLRDRKANYHPMSRAELDRYAPGFPWQPYLEALRAEHVQELVMNTDTSVQACARIFNETPLDSWRSYLVFHWVENQIDLLPGTLRKASPTQSDRERRGVQFVNDKLGDLIGSIYVARHFSPAHRTLLDEMIVYLKQAFAERIKAASWLDAATREAALAKLRAMSVMAGYSDTLRTYSGAEIRADDLIGNVQRLADENWRWQLAHLGKPTGEWEWAFPPQKVDAIYTPQLNRITFPAGLLQPPLFDRCADAAVNFGAIGYAIAHEMGHGFDDQGAFFDATGTMRNWWSPDAMEQFRSRLNALAEQFSSYSPLPSVTLNGWRSLGENSADLTGLTIALDAYRLYVRDKNSNVAPVLDGTTGEQRFFLAYAQYWRALEPEGWLRKSAAQMYHSPPSYRVNGIVRNLDAWYEAFGIKESDELYLSPQKRVRVW